MALIDVNLKSLLTVVHSFARRVLRKCNKSKMRLLKQDIELLCNQVEKTGINIQLLLKWCALVNMCTCS